MATPSPTGGALDFFGAQEQAHRQTRGLVVYFVLAVIAVIIAVYLTVSGAMVWLGFNQGEAGMRGEIPTWWNLERALWIGGSTTLLIVGTALAKLAEFSQGGGAVARSLGGRKVDETTQHPAERRLLNIVEEMAIASGTPVPEVYVLDREEAINAFAAGTRPDNAAVAVTQGTLHLLNRDELQGVIAHEFSHILNGDMRLNLRLGGLLHGIMALSVIAGAVLRAFSNSGAAYHGSRRRDSREGGGGGAGLILVIIVAAVAVYLIGQIGSFFGHLIQSAISRQREFLADASAVQFTRQADGIAGALRKIGGLSQHGKIDEPKASPLAHLFFANALRGGGGSLLATHPPLEERIRRIDPSWDGAYATVSAEQREQAQKTVREYQSAQQARYRSRDPGELVAATGIIDQRAVEYARDLRQQLPPTIQGVSGQPQAARLALLGLLVERAPGKVRTAQLAWLEPRYPGQTERLQAVVAALDNLPRRDQLPLVELAVATLRQSSPEDNKTLIEELRALAGADRRVDLREWCLLTLVDRRLRAQPPSLRTVNDIRVVQGEMERVLSRLAQLDPEPAAAFAHAIKGLYLEKYLRFNAEEAGDLGQLEHDLEALRAGSPGMKRAYLTACGRAIAHDRSISPDEAELFRTLAIVLDVPMPPVVAE